MNKEKQNETHAVRISVRIVLIVLSVGMIFWYRISGFVAFGNVVGIVIFALIMLAAIFTEPLSRLLKKLRRKKVMKIITDVLLVLIVVFFVYAAAAVGIMIAGSTVVPEEDATVVVLGCQVKGDVPSHTLQIRLDTAYDYLKEHPAARAVLSGGKGEGEHISEAQCMYEYLTEKGIDGSRLFREDRSTTTQENIRFSREIIQKNGLNASLAIVTDWYHEFRAGLICEREGAEHGAVSAPTAVYLTAHLVTREIFAIPHEILFRR